MDDIIEFIEWEWRTPYSYSKNLYGCILSIM